MEELTHVFVIYARDKGVRRLHVKWGRYSSGDYVTRERLRRSHWSAFGLKVFCCSQKPKRVRLRPLVGFCSQRPNGLSLIAFTCAWFVLITAMQHTEKTYVITAITTRQQLAVVLDKNSGGGSHSRLVLSRSQASVMKNEHEKCFSDLLLPPNDTNKHNSQVTEPRMRQ